MVLYPPRTSIRMACLGSWIGWSRLQRYLVPSGFQPPKGVVLEDPRLDCWWWDWCCTPFSLQNGEMSKQYRGIPKIFEGCRCYPQEYTPRQRLIKGFEDMEAWLCCGNFHRQGCCSYMGNPRQQHESWGSKRPPFPYSCEVQPATPHQLKRLITQIKPLPINHHQPPTSTTINKYRPLPTISRINRYRY